jgi:hypothetical protein
MPITVAGRIERRRSAAVKHPPILTGYGLIP